jgi:hypothetical protein
MLQTTHHQNPILNEQSSEEFIFGDPTLARLTAETRIGSDHTPLILDSGENAPRRMARFSFENSWLAVPGFVEQLKKWWAELLISNVNPRDPIDVWHGQASGLR